MVLSSLFFKKNDSCKDSIEDLQWQVFSYCQNFKDMASLFERLQAQSACFHRLQQSLSLYGYKKPELQASSLGPRALPILFLNQLLLGQSKCSCKYFVKVFAEKPE